MSNLRRHPEDVAAIIRAACQQIADHPTHTAFVLNALRNVADELERRSIPG